MPMSVNGDQISATFHVEQALRAGPGNRVKSDSCLAEDDELAVERID